MLTTWAWALFASYLAFGLYTWWTHRKVMYLFAKNFPDENNRYFAKKSFNEKRIAGVQFLWDKTVNDVISANDQIIRLRVHARRCFVVFLLLLFMFPVLVFAIVFVQNRIFR